MTLRKELVRASTVLLAAGVLGGCGGQEAPSASTDPVGAPAPQESMPGDSDPGDIQGRVPTDLIVSTNEPFWQARAEDGVVVLEGAGVEGRRMPIHASHIDNSTDPQSRLIRAGDDAGKVELRVTDAACQDDMSGADFPMTGTLSIDGGEPIRGCARPASMPPPRPPGEDAAAESIPSRFTGYWAPEDANCDRQSVGGLEITERELRFHESVAVPRYVELLDDDTLVVTARYSGEGQEWTEERTLTLSGDGQLTIEGPEGDAFTRVRCPAGG